MQKYILYFTFFLPFISQAQPSDCISEDGKGPTCNGIISTDPDKPINEEDSSRKNTFDWRKTAWQVYHPDSQEGVFKENGKAIDKRNPFTTMDSRLGMINYSRFTSTDDNLIANLDFHPQDGWELLYKFNGITLRGDLIPVDKNRDSPIFMLYNRYTGKIRILATSSAVGAEKFIVRVQFRGYEQPGTKVSGLFGKNAGTITALDKKTTMVKAVHFAHATSAPNKFFVSEFNTNYDPCICNTKSELLIKFFKSKTATLKAKGRLIATSVSLDVGAQNGRNYLSSVFTDDPGNVQVGSVTYQNLDKLKQHYASSVGESGTPFLRKAFKWGLELVLSAAGSAAGKELGKLLSRPATRFVTKVIKNEDLKKKLKDKVSEKALSEAFGEVGKNAKQLSTVILPPNQPGVRPNISFIEGELALSGTIEEQTDEGGDVIIKTPGSKDSDKADEEYYPLYNEALGVFALLETPKIKYYLKMGRDWYKTYYKLDKNTIKYYFNPAAEVNAAKTKIYAALVVNSNACPDLRYSSAYVEDHFNLVSSNIYITDFYPLEALPDIAPAGYIHTLKTYKSNLKHGGIYCDATSVSLRLQILYEFKSKRYDKVVKNYEILDFATEIVNTTTKPQTTLPPELPENITIYGTYRKRRWFTILGDFLRTSAGDFNMNQNITLKALNNITINGNLQGLSKSLSLIAGNSVIVNNNVTIGNNVSFETQTFDNVYGIPKIPPVSPAYVKSFCSRERETYKANNPYYRLAGVSSEQENEIDTLLTELISIEPAFGDDIILLPFLPDQDIIIDTLDASDSTDIDIDAEDVDLDSVEINRRRINSKVKIYPNPTTGLTHIKLDFAEAQDVSITVYTVLGVKVYEVNLSNVKATTYDLDLSGQASGMYLVSIVGTKDQFQERVWIE